MALYFQWLLKVKAHIPSKFQDCWTLKSTSPSDSRIAKGAGPHPFQIQGLLKVKARIPWQIQGLLKAKARSASSFQGVLKVKAHILSKRKDC